jgi:hypothetical protein
MDAGQAGAKLCAVGYCACSIDSHTADPARTRLDGALALRSGKGCSGWRKARGMQAALM